MTRDMASSTQSPTSPSFATFLDTDPYPSATRDGRPRSSGSIATNATNESGPDEFRPSHDQPRNALTMTGPVGEPGLPPSRTSGAKHDNTLHSKRTVAHAPGSRRLTSRSNTGAEATHVVSLPGQTVFRPMSSQKLQAQRNQLPDAPEEQDETAVAANRDPRPNHHHRYSNASVNTLKELQALRRDDQAPPLPVSRGTQATTDGTYTAGSFNSATPLQARQNNYPNFNADQFVTDKNRFSDQRSKSPRSFRASLGMGSRRASKMEHERRPSPRLHEKLGSISSSPNDADAYIQSSRRTRSAGKNYEYFAGNLLFCLSGRCLNTRAKPLNLLTFVLVSTPAVLFFACSAPWLWYHVSPALPIVFAYFFYITISSFIHAAVTDPGILPRNIHPHPPNPEEERDPLTVGPALTEWVMVKSFLSAHRSPHPGRSNNSAEDGQGANGLTTAMEVPTKYCKTCNIWRPPRTHHCRICDVCVENQDHHCVWLNNCVGRRNYRYFFSFVALGSLSALLLIVFSIIHIVYYAKQNHISFVDTITGRSLERVAFAVFIYSALALPYPASLFIYHLFLVARGETTREYLNSHKFQKKDRHRPFTQSSSLRNWIAVLLRPRTPSSMQFRHAYQPGDVRYGHTVPKQQRKKDLQGRFSVPPNGNGANGKAKSAAGGDAPLEMKQFSSTTGGQGSNPQAKNAGGLSGPVNRTPR